MAIAGDQDRDVMQVCLNGHVITDLLRSYPEKGQSHCERCGATTLCSCPTCGQDLPGAVLVPGLVPAGQSSPPHYCSGCGNPFPWTRPPSASAVAPDGLAALESLLRRLPRVVRQLRVRQTDRPPFRVQDERDLEDLVRALLPLHFDDIRPESRTPHYAATTRTDFLLQPDGIAVTVKHCTPEGGGRRFEDELREDVAYYSDRSSVRTLVALVYDPEGLLTDRSCLESTWARLGGEFPLVGIIAP